MENITAEFVCFKAYRKHKPPVLGNSDNWELTEGTDIYIGQLHLVELLKLRNFYTTEIIGTEPGKFVKIQTAVQT
jgi:hypothetical protein